MSKFKKKSKASQDIPTSALPDIIFMLLFFFMVTTVMREQDILVEQKIPQATQLTKLQKKSLVSVINIGPPKDASRWGTESRIQLNDAIADVDDIVLWVNERKDELDEVERDQITINLKVDKDAKMGIVTDVQEELKEANALKIMYNTIQDTDS
ncbi:ExbD/TolR family protein [Xanthovirga aplysinae]|uniref:ExbD/TolR family protein n=1 Tax=Xanthovirga aplysinae TaxID=2529853 RepID=UPI0012BBAAB1|nr:biopolymer transporter ExbD [Xanthovirga aplysinae]MTI32792.1 biopolymer transporter ExbD [Xanthovirga aplysinae]